MTFVILINVPKTAPLPATANNTGDKCYWWLYYVTKDMTSLFIETSILKPRYE